jgi:Protein of unknown function (DUF2778)
MWIYEITSGRLRDKNGLGVGFGYSGYGPDKNQVVDEDQKDLGPIPEGQYGINSPRDTDKHGPYVMPLTPYATTDLKGRPGGFLIHGDSVLHPGTASHGCIILARSVRQKIWESGDHDLTVVA